MFVKIRRLSDAVWKTPRWNVIRVRILLKFAVKFHVSIFFYFLRFNMGTRVYIGGLPYRVKERDIERFFRGYGKLREVLIKNGYGFVVSGFFNLSWVRKKLEFNCYYCM